MFGTFVENLNIKRFLLVCVDFLWRDLAANIGRRNMTQLPEELYMFALWDRKGLHLL